MILLFRSTFTHFQPYFSVREPATEPVSGRYRHRWKVYTQKPVHKVHPNATHHNKELIALAMFGILCQYDTSFTGLTRGKMHEQSSCFLLTQVNTVTVTHLPASDKGSYTGTQRTCWIPPSTGIKCGRRKGVGTAGKQGGKSWSGWRKTAQGRWKQSLLSQNKRSFAWVHEAGEGEAVEGVQ